MKDRATPWVLGTVTVIAITVITIFVVRNYVLKPGVVNPNNDGGEPAKLPGQMDVVAKALDNPCGVTIQPGTGHVFVAMNGRIVRVQPGKTAKIEEEITGFPKDVYGKGPKYDIGPLGLVFLDAATLAVGGGGLKDGEELVRFYKVKNSAPATGNVPDADKMFKSAGPIKAGKESVNGEGNYFGLAYHTDTKTLFITSNGDDTKGWINKIDLSNMNDPLKLETYIQSKIEAGIDAPTGATINSEGKLVVSQLGEIHDHADSLLTIYDPATGKLEKKLPTGLRDLVAIAYHPKSGQLYGVDFSWAVADQGGLFTLTIKGDKVEAKKIGPLKRPTAMAFAEDGTLYVTIIGDGGKDGKHTGQLVRFPNLK